MSANNLGELAYYLFGIDYVFANEVEKRANASCARPKNTSLACNASFSIEQKCALNKLLSEALLVNILLLDADARLKAANGNPSLALLADIVITIVSCIAEVFSKFDLSILSINNL